MSQIIPGLGARSPKYLSNYKVSKRCPTQCSHLTAEFVALPTKMAALRVSITGDAALSD